MTSMLAAYGFTFRIRFIEDEQLNFILSDGRTVLLRDLYKTYVEDEKSVKKQDQFIRFLNEFEKQQGIFSWTAEKILAEVFFFFFFYNPKF